MVGEGVEEKRRFFLDMDPSKGEAPNAEPRDESLPEPRAQRALSLARAVGLGFDVLRIATPYVLQKRLSPKHHDDPEHAEAHEDKMFGNSWANFVRMGQTLIPALRVRGTQLPETLSRDDGVLVISNHVSTLDPFLIAIAVNAPVERETGRLVRWSGITLSTFGKLPVVGSLIDHKKGPLVGLRKGESDEELEAKFQAMWKRGVRIFVLFPEGRLTDKAYMVQDQKHPDAVQYKHLCTPRKRAFDAVRRAIGENLKWTVDVTNVYAGWDPAAEKFNPFWETISRTINCLSATLPDNT